MRISLILVLVVLHGATLALPAELESREGYVMPTACKSREAEGGREVHTTECALELECVVTGFGLWVDGEFFEFDDDGDQIALKYFRETTKKDHHLVTVLGDFGGAEVDVETLEPVSP